MSEYGTPPSDPHQPNPYGGQPNQYAGQPGYPQQPAGTYANWGQRVGAFLIDYILAIVAGIPLFIGYFMLIGDAVDSTVINDDGTFSTTSSGGASGAAIVLILIGLVTYIGFFIWNYCIKQGKTGYTIGKGVVGIKLIGIQSGQPIGGGLAFVRQLAHFVDGITCYIGYLWPLWDDKKQTFADKIMSTVVIEQPKG